MQPHRVGLFLAVTFFCCAAEAQIVSLTVLAPGTRGQGLSPNGKLVCGYHPAKGGYMWSEGVGIIEIPGQPYGVTDVGTVTGVQGGEAFLWSAATGIQMLGTLPGKGTSYGYGIATNGFTRIVGRSDLTAFQWTAASGMQKIYFPGSDVSGEAFGVSADGTHVVGWAASGVTSINEAFLWSETTGIVGLGFMPGTTPFWGSVAHAVSPNGEYVAGRADGPNYSVSAFIWNVEEGMVDLGKVKPNQYIAHAYSVSNDGRAVGTAWFSGENASRGFLWTKAGMVDLHSLVLKSGFPVETWNFVDARGISADGSTIVGTCHTPNGEQAFVIRLGVKPVKPALQTQRVAVP